tara:strand:+ start:301 stop:633 length:333 start_codon:yes stop_codon:yes gene_type:complete
LGYTVITLKNYGYISHQAILIIALLASAVGKDIVKSPLFELLSDPKLRINTVLFAVPAVVEELYIIAPLAVMLELENVKSAKSVIAVVLDDVGVTLVNAAPPEEYPVPDA